MHCDRDGVRRYETAAALELQDDVHHLHMHAILASVPALDGAAVLRDSARAAFTDALTHVLDGVDDHGTRSSLVEGYYAYLGLGLVWLDTLDTGVIEAPTSHVASAWSRLGGTGHHHACALTEGFLEAAIHTITGHTVQVREHECAAAEASRCRYTVVWDDRSPSSERPCVGGSPLRRLQSPPRISFESDADGLIQIDGRFLAQLPAGLYAHALAEWLAVASRRGAPVLAHALAQLDYVSAPSATPLRLAPAPVSGAAARSKA
jgi:hypothetical protein